jgi:hypothetical protein
MIVGLVPTYREGPLAADAVRSLLPCCDAILVTEGPIGEPTDAGTPTDISELKRNPKVTFTTGAWPTEISKRNAMLERTRRYPAPVWGVYLDADEVMINAELIPSLIWASEQHAEPGNDVTAIPIMRTEIDGGVGRNHRIIRLDRLERHVLSMSQWQFYDQVTVAIFPSIHVWRAGEPVTETARPPLQGEPHFHHRAYLRPPVRGEQRLHKLEGTDYIEQNREALESLGFPAEQGAPVIIDRPEMIIATDTGKTDPDPLGILRGIKGGK